jgi:hypothetical protein
MNEQEFEKAVRWMMEQGYATGHGDSVIDLLKELEWQVVEREREACAKLVEPSEEHRRDASWGYLGGADGVELLDSIAKAIRERGEK